MDLKEKIDLAAKWIANSFRLVVFTGAGISRFSDQIGDVLPPIVEKVKQLMNQ